MLLTVIEEIFRLKEESYEVNNNILFLIEF